MKIQRFQSEELPYGILERFGLTQEMLEDLPQKAIEDILDGRRSPVLPIHVTDESGEEIHARTRFAFIRMDDNSVDVVWKSPVCVTPEAQVPLTLESKFRMTPIKS